MKIKIFLLTLFIGLFAADYFKPATPQCEQLKVIVLDREAIENLESEF